MDILEQGRMKSFLRHLSFDFFTKTIAYCYFRLLFFTYRLKVIDCTQGRLPFNKSEGLFYLWHEHAVSGLYFMHQKKAVGHLVSDHSPDGCIAGFIAKRLGLRVMYSNRKPSFIRKALDVLEMNHRLYMVGDGAHGPAQKLQRELPYLCARTGVPLVFIECKVSTALSLVKRWDQLKIPLPFSTITVIIHEPRFFALGTGNEVVEKTNQSGVKCTLLSDS